MTHWFVYGWSSINIVVPDGNNDNDNNNPLLSTVDKPIFHLEDLMILKVNFDHGKHVEDPERTHRSNLCGDLCLKPDNYVGKYKLKNT